MQPNSTRSMVRTVGHSDRSLEEYLDLLTVFGVGSVVDVRRYPNSRRFPHFSEGNLSESLGEVGIEYRHWPELGGYRDPSSGGVNTALSEGLRGVADHLNTDRGQTNLDELQTVIEDSENGEVVLMCAERDYNQCHRRLIADHLTVRDVDVEHIIDVDTVRGHDLHENARPEDGIVQYPGLL